MEKLGGLILHRKNNLISGLSQWCNFNHHAASHKEKNRRAEKPRVICIVYCFHYGHPHQHAYESEININQRFLIASMNNAKMELEQEFLHW